MIFRNSDLIATGLLLLLAYSIGIRIHTHTHLPSLYIVLLCVRVLYTRVYCPQDGTRSNESLRSFTWWVLLLPPFHVCSCSSLLPSENLGTLQYQYLCLCVYSCSVQDLSDICYTKTAINNTLSAQNSLNFLLALECISI